MSLLNLSISYEKNRVSHTEVISSREYWKVTMMLIFDSENFGILSGRDDCLLITRFMP